MAGSPLAGLLVWAAIIYMPFFMYRFMRASFAECRFQLGFAELWAEGIASFFLGSLFPALFAYMALRFAAPDLIDTVFQQSIDTFRSVQAPEWNAWADALENIRDKAGLPTPADIAAQIISMNLMGGMILSFFLSAWLKIRYSSPRRRERFSQSHPGTQK